jgi:hypothetical protein
MFRSKTLKDGLKMALKGKKGLGGKDWIRRCNSNYVLRLARDLKRANNYQFNK